MRAELAKALHPKSCKREKREKLLEMMKVREHVPILSSQKNFKFFHFLKEFEILIFKLIKALEQNTEILISFSKILSKHLISPKSN